MAAPARRLSSIPALRSALRVMPVVMPEAGASTDTTNTPVFSGHNAPNIGPPAAEGMRMAS